MSISLRSLPVLACGLFVLLSGAAGPLRAQQTPATVTADLLRYDEQERGTDVYPVRILVARGFIRIDDDADDGDFVLLDRATGDLYSVSREERRILVIPFRHLEPKRPDDLVLDARVEQDTSAPPVGGVRPVLVSLSANGTTCYHVAAVPGLLDAAVSGLADYARVLGDRQFGSLQTMPADMQTPCFLARYVYAPDRHLQYGLPIQEWDDAGYRRALVNYQAGAEVARDLFVLPEDYDRLVFGSD